MKRTSPLLLKLKLGAALGLAALICNFFLNLLFGQPLTLPLGNSLILIAGSTFGIAGGISALVAGGIPFSIYNSEPLEFLRFGVITIAVAVSAERNSKLNLSSVVLMCWLIGLAFSEEVSFLNVLNKTIEPQALFWSDLLSATVASTLLLNPDLRCRLTRAPLPISLLYFNTQFILSFAALLTFIGYSLNVGSPTPILALVLFVSAIHISANILGYLWTNYINNNLNSFTADPLLTENRSRSLSGANAHYWRKVINNSDEQKQSASWTVPYKNSAENSPLNTANSTQIKPAVCAINASGEIIFATPSMSILLSIPHEKLIGCDIEALDIPNIWKNVIKDVAMESFKNGIQTQQLKLSTPNNQNRFFEISGRLASGATSQDEKSKDNDSAMISIRDVTDRYMIEEVKLHAHKMETLGSLVSGLTHTLSNYITTVSTRLSLVQHSQDPSGKVHLQDIQEHTNETGEMLRGLISLVNSSSEASKTTNLSFFIEERLNILSKLIGAKYNIIFSKTSEPTGIVCNRSLVEQALTNLVLYGRDSYLQKTGEISLNVTTEELSVDASKIAGGVPPGRYCRIDMTHKGNPLNKHLLGSLFDTSKASSPGALGLAIITAIVKSQGGFITAQSEINKGTTISLYFPWQPVAESPARAIRDSAWPEAPSPTLKGRKVLIVEDEPAVRETTSFILTTLGCKVSDCDNGEQALELASKDSFDLILLDYMLPTISGEDLMTKLKDFNQDIKIVVMTGYGSSIDSDIATEVVQKPFDLDSLTSAIHSALGQTVH